MPWDYLRIALFYGPVWFVICLTLAIYLRAGSVIYQKHRELHSISGIESFGTDTQPYAPLVTHASIQVTSEIACFAPVHRSLSTNDVPTRSFMASSFRPYSVTVEGGPIDPFSMLQNLGESSAPIQDPSGPWPNPSPLRTEVSAKSARREFRDSYAQRGKAIEASSAAWAYTKYAMLFFIALLVTWVGGYTQLTQFNSAQRPSLIWYRFPPRSTEYTRSLAPTTSRSGSTMRRVLCFLCRGSGIVLFMCPSRGRRLKRYSGICGAPQRSCETFSCLPCQAITRA